MIFVTVGTSSWKFDRLVLEMDRISASIHEDVIIQFGASSVRLANAKGYDYLPPVEMDGFYRSARLIVAHAGSGTIIRALRLQKPIIIVPRTGTNEAYDDHQIELARAFETDPRIQVIYETSQLESTICKMNEELIKSKAQSMHGGLVDRLRNYLNSIDDGCNKNHRIDQ